MNGHEQTKHQAEARATAMLEDAEARAEAAVSNAEARVRALIDGHRRRGQDAPKVDLAPPLSHLEKIAREYIHKHLPSTDVFREVVSIRAYYRAEQRRFGQGEEENDWLKAEQELLDAPVFDDLPACPP